MASRGVLFEDKYDDDGYIVKILIEEAMNAQPKFTKFGLNAFLHRYLLHDTIFLDSPDLREGTPKC